MTIGILGEPTMQDIVRWDVATWEALLERLGVADKATRDRLGRRAHRHEWLHYRLVLILTARGGVAAR
jgi:hypothetical protein